MNDRIIVSLIPECSVCILSSLNKMLPALTDSRERQLELLALAFKRLSEGYHDKTPPHPLSVRLYREIYTLTNANDPYREIKAKSTDAAKRVLPIVEQHVRSAEGIERLRVSVAAAITGNLIDFNTRGHQPRLDDLEQAFHSILSEGFRPDHTSRLWNTITEDSGSLVYIGDNAGEVILDIPLLRIFNEHNWRTTFVVKDRPMVNDATEDDVRETEIPQLARVMSSGAWAHGVPRWSVSQEFLETVSNADLVIAKGQANIETLPEIQEEYGFHACYIARAKCPHIAEVLGVPVGSNVVMFRAVSSRN